MYIYVYMCVSMQCQCETRETHKKTEVHQLQPQQHVSRSECSITADCRNPATVKSYLQNQELCKVLVLLFWPSVAISPAIIRS